MKYIIEYDPAYPDDGRYRIKLRVVPLGSYTVNMIDVAEAPTLDEAVEKLGDLFYDAMYHYEYREARAISHHRRIQQKRSK